MQKYYLIPAEIVQESGESTRRPKYVDSLKLNWAGVYVQSKDIYILTVNESQDLTKLTKLEENSEVVTLDGKRKTKDNLKTQLNLDVKIKDTEDEVEFIAKLQEPNFTKEKLWVSD